MNKNFNLQNAIDSLPVVARQLAEALMAFSAGDMNQEELDFHMESFRLCKEAAAQAAAEMQAQDDRKSQEAAPFEDFSHVAKSSDWIRILFQAGRILEREGKL